MLSATRKMRPVVLSCKYSQAVRLSGFCTFGFRPRRLLLRIVTALAFVVSSAALAQAEQPADVILHNGKIWTVDERQPVAQAVAIHGTHIARVGSNDDVLVLRGPTTKVIDLAGKLVLPGFNDGHTHFENATNRFFRARLDGVNELDEFVARLHDVVQEVPDGFWITGGNWGPTGDGVPFRPDLAAVDAVTPDNPVLVRSTSGAYFANSLALRLVRVDRNTPDPRGGTYEHDPQTGALTGMLMGRAGEIVRAMLPPVTVEQKLVAARVLQEKMNAYGITSITDIARIEEISQRQTFHTNVERSFSDIRIFKWLKARGELALRVYAMLPLAVWRDVADAGLMPGSGDHMIRYGGLKALSDSTLMLAPFADRPGNAGGWSFRVRDEQELRQRIIDAYRAGFDVAVHALGDKAVRFVVNSYAEALTGNGVEDHRLRLVHAWYSTPEDLQAIGDLRLIVDITPSHLTHEWRKVESAVGPQRAQWAHAWRTMLDGGAKLNIVSDMPGGYTRGNLSPFNPLENIYYAITRKDLSGNPPGGWHPEQRLTVQEAIRAYTLNPAYASRESDIKGSIVAGKLADLVVLSKDITAIPPEQLLSTEVLLTILGGRVVFEKP